MIVRTRRDGRGFALLAPGQYVVTPIFKQRERLFPPPERVVTVAPGAFTDVIVDYETGER